LLDALYRIIDWQRANPPVLTPDELNRTREQDEAERALLS
jgi:hypothetical protein